MEKQAAEKQAAPAGPAKSSRGNFISKVGTVASIKDAISDKEVAKFTVNKIAKGTCTAPYAQPADNGNIIFVTVTAQTTPALAESSFPKWFISAADFKFIAKNGTTFNGNLGTASTFGCIPDDQTLPMAGLGPDEKATGIVVLDAPQPSGTLIVKSVFGPGYEYTF